MREVDGRKASPSAGRPNITEPKIAVVACQNHRTEPNEGHAQSTPRPRLRVAFPSVHACTCSYKEPRDPDRQTVKSQQGAPSCIQRSTSIPTRGRHSHAHTHIKRTLTRHDSLSCTAYVQLHTCVHAHNEQSEPFVLPPAVYFAQSKHSAARSQVAGMTSEKIFLSSL